MTEIFDEDHEKILDGIKKLNNNFNEDYTVQTNIISMIPAERGYKALFGIDEKYYLSYDVICWANVEIVKEIAGSAHVFADASIKESKVEGMCLIPYSQSLVPISEISDFICYRLPTDNEVTLLDRIRMCLKEK